MQGYWNWIAILILADCKVKEANKNYYRGECSYGAFIHTFSLPGDVANKVASKSPTVFWKSGCRKAKKPRKKK
jgi:hypothetical protein